MYGGAISSITLGIPGASTAVATVFDGRPLAQAGKADKALRRIRDLADEHDIPIVENPPLARALYAGVELDEEVPPEHYQAVAEGIGYVMRLKNPGKYARQAPS